jgi:hypothetical protein
MSQVITALAAIPLGEAAVIHGVRVVRKSLLGFQVEDGRDLVEAPEAARRIRSTREGQRVRVRVLVCTRCGGDGLGRRNRGACGLCHGPGIQVRLPLCGLPEARPEDLASAVDQALVALRAACQPRARESLLALLGEALPFASQPQRERSLHELRRRGFDVAAEAFAAVVGAPRAA